MGKIEIIFSKHAMLKMKQRGISLELVENAIKNPDIIQKDKFDESLEHYIAKTNERFLRVIARALAENKIFIISVFYDRRLKRR